MLAIPLTRRLFSVKTVTIVEAVKQIVTHDASARILICAPSNSACDVVAERLVDLGASKLFLLYAPFRSPLSVPSSLKTFTRRSQSIYQTPPLDEFLGIQVVVVTCPSGNLQSRFEIPRGHFSHIFIDECGQAEEPEGAFFSTPPPPFFL